MVGIKDIAKKAGVSISTVSYALNGSPKVTEETRARIQAIARDLNYVPNMAARTLKRRQTNIIGVYLADYAGSFYGRVARRGLKKSLETFWLRNDCLQRQKIPFVYTRAYDRWSHRFRLDFSFRGN